MILTPSTPFILIVESQDQGLRLDKFLALKIPDISRTRLQELIEGEYVRENGQILHAASLKVKDGQSFEIIVPPSIEATPQPEDISLEILYEDEDVIVINKKAGMVVHPAPGNLQGTLVNALLSHCGASLSGINGVKRPGIVHRLDKETSGLLIAAKNDNAHKSLSHQLSTREMGRVYQAIVWGMLFPQEGTIEGAIGRDPRNRKRMAIREGGRFSRTHYKVLKFFGKTASLIECRLETGRTHQIRVHLTAKSHSLLGDSVYGKTPKVIPPFVKEYLKEKWPQGRQALHAKELAFIHPKTKEMLHFEIDLPEDMRNLIDMLNSQQ